MDDLSENPPAVPEMEDRILPWSQVRVISGLSRTTIWRMQKSGDFPASVQVSANRVGWWQSEILDWHRSRQPRRLPEPRPLQRRAAVPRATSPARSEAETTAADARSPAGEPPAAPLRPVSGVRRRKAPTCENQTAFDF